MGEPIGCSVLDFGEVDGEEDLVDEVEEGEDSCATTKCHESTFTDLQPSSERTLNFYFITRFAIVQIFTKPADFVHFDDKTQVCCGFLFEDWSGFALVLESADDAVCELADGWRHAES